MEERSVNKEKLKNIFQKFLKIFGYVMVLFYLILSSVLLFTNIFSTTLPPIKRYILGGMLLAYGIFRAYRVFQSQKDNNEDEE